MRFAGIIVVYGLLLLVGILAQVVIVGGAFEPTRAIFVQFSDWLPEAPAGLLLAWLIHVLLADRRSQRNSAEDLVEK